MACHKQDMFKEKYPFEPNELIDKLNYLKQQLEDAQKVYKFFKVYKFVVLFEDMEELEKKIFSYEELEKVYRIKWWIESIFKEKCGVKIKLSKTSWRFCKEDSIFEVNEQTIREALEELVRLKGCNWASNILLWGGKGKGICMLFEGVEGVKKRIPVEKTKGRDRYA